eukprot:1158612-Pelagomonas_calceolata.AAC.12
MQTTEVIRCFLRACVMRRDMTNSGTLSNCEAAEICFVTLNKFDEVDQLKDAASEAHLSLTRAKED